MFEKDVSTLGRLGYSGVAVLFFSLFALSGASFCRGRPTVPLGSTMRLGPGRRPGQTVRGEEPPPSVGARNSGADVDPGSVVWFRSSDEAPMPPPRSVITKAQAPTGRTDSPPLGGSRLSSVPAAPPPGSRGGSTAPTLAEKQEGAGSDSFVWRESRRPGSDSAESDSGPHGTSITSVPRGQPSAPQTHQPPAPARVRYPSGSLVPDSADLGLPRTPTPSPKGNPRADAPGLRAGSFSSSDEDVFVPPAPAFSSVPLSVPQEAPLASFTSFPLSWTPMYASQLPSNPPAARWAAPVGGLDDCDDDDAP